MSTTKKYVSIEKLGLYDEKIKDYLGKADEAALKSAKDYADSLASNYDAAGAAATAEANAKAYADGKDASIQAAQAAAEAAASAASVADGKAVVAQGEVDALETYVGVIPEGATATSVIGYIQEKTAGIASEGAMNELSGRVGVVEGKVATIEGDYLKGADKTALEGQISAVQGAVDTEKSRAEGIEAGLRTDVDAIKADYLKAADKTALQNSIDGVAEDVAEIVADYLKAADKTELEGKIALKADQTALDGEIDRAKKAEADLQTQINTIMNNPDAEEAINSINEFAAWVEEHGTIADGMRADINKNEEDIAGIDTAYKAADEVINGRLDVLEAVDHEAYKAADTVLKNELDGDIADLADAIEAAKTEASNNDAVVLEEAQKGIGAVQTALNNAVAALEGADSALSGRIEVLEGKFSGEGSVEDQIDEAKQAAIDAAAADATSKANAAEAAAKGHADSLNTAMNTRVEALEAIDHDHSNKAELDLIASGDKAKWDEAAGKAHEHSNLTVLEGITAGKVSAWDAAEGNAKTYADGLNTAMNTRVEALETWHNNFLECSEEDIQKLFA